MRWGGGPQAGPRAGSDLVPGPELPRKAVSRWGVQDPILLKLGVSFRGSQGLRLGSPESVGWQGEAVAHTARAPSRPALSLSSGLQAPRGVTTACPQEQPPCGPPSPITQGQDSGGLRAACPHSHFDIGSATPGWQGQVEELGRPGHQVLLALPGPLPLRLL